MLFSFCIILFIESVKILIQCVSFPSLVLFHQVQLISFLFYFLFVFLCGVILLLSSQCVDNVP